MNASLTKLILGKSNSLCCTTLILEMKQGIRDEMKEMKQGIHEPHSFREINILKKRK